MTWLLLSFLSAVLLGFYDVAKKRAVTANAVLPVLLLTTLFSTLIFAPMLISTELELGWFKDTILETSHRDWSDHLMVMLKAIIVLGSWILGYFAIKHLPITLVGPVNSTRPMLVLAGAVLLFGERLNAWQWSGVILSMISLALLSRSSQKEGISFKSNLWVIALIGAVILGAISALYDRHIMKTLDPIFVQGWNNLYQLMIMSVIVAIIWYPQRTKSTPFRWSWAIPMISILLTMADMAYFYALQSEEAMIAIVSMVRRGSVVVSFASGALLFNERNLQSKALDLLLIFIAMILIYIGTAYYA